MSTAIIEDLLWLGLEWDGEIALPVRAAAALRRGARAAEGGRASSIPASAPAPTSPPRSPPAPRRRTGRTGRSIRAPAGRCAGERDGAWRGAACLAARRRAGRSARPGRSTGSTAIPRCRPSRSAFGDVVLARKDAPASYHLAVTRRRCRAGRHRRRARPRPLRRHRRPPAAPGAARPADAALSSPSPCWSTPRAAASPSATARRRSPTCARPAPTRPRWSRRCARGELPAGYSLAEA